MIAQDKKTAELAEFMETLTAEVQRCNHMPAQTGNTSGTNADNKSIELPERANPEDHTVVLASMGDFVSPSADTGGDMAQIAALFDKHALLQNTQLQSLKSELQHLLKEPKHSEPSKIAQRTKALALASPTV